MAEQADIVIDLYADWIGVLKSQLRAAGYAPAADNEPLRIAVQFFNVLLRRIETRPRTVLFAKDLVCPPEHQSGLDEIFRKAQAGEDLTPHLSRLLLKTDFHDPLLNDWGLHHLHLGGVLERDGFVERTGPLLFVLVRPATVHAVTVRGHNGAWTDVSLLETVLANWPDLLAPYELKGIRAAEPVSPQDRAALRKAGVMTPTELSNGKLYMSPGGGINTAGSNVQTVMEHDRMAQRLRQIEQHVRDTLESLRAQLPKGLQFGSPPTFRLEFKDGDPVVAEVNAKFGFQYRLG